MAEKEYIEREALQKIFENRMQDNNIMCPVIKVLDVIEIIEKQHTADVAPVRHGRWKKSKGNERPTENGFVHDDRYVCDCCGWGCCCETKLDFNYCPNCGAKMDGDKNGS